MRLAKESTRQLVDYACMLLNFFVDMSYAYPSPALFQQLELDPTDYYPGVKFVRMIHAVHSMSDDETASTFNKIFHEQYAAAEEAILHRIPYRYLTSHEVYTNWAEELEKVLRVDDDRTIKLRYKACRQRIEAPDTCPKKTIGNVFLNKISLYYLHHGGMVQYGFDADYIDSEENNRAYRRAGRCTGA